MADINVVDNSLRPTFETTNRLAVQPSENALVVSDNTKILSVIDDGIMVPLSNYASLTIDNMIFKILDEPEDGVDLPCGNKHYKLAVKIGDQATKYIYELQINSSNAPKEAFEYHVPTYAIVEDEGFTHYYPLNKINIY